MGKIYKMSETSNTQNVISGIYKINFPNGKCYIGLSNNIRKRIWKHNHDDYKLGRVVGNAIHKYGDITEFEVLEEISINNRDIMNERERYWIKYYHSNNNKYGYNVTEGGDRGGTVFGTAASSASINDIQLHEILNLLQNNREIPMQQIAQQYNIGISTISNINQGHTYTQPDIKYPIRTQEESNKSLLTGTKSSSSKLTESQIKQVYDDIINSTLTFTAIGKKYNVSNSTIGLINQGKRYHNNKFSYPLRNEQMIKKCQYSKKSQ